MKLRKDAIRQGMVIHCPTKENAKDLLEHLDDLGYRWENDTSLKTDLNYDLYGTETCYWILFNHVMCGYVDSAKYHKDKITEFSDLIEPDENLTNLANPKAEMSAVEVLEWFEKYREIENGILTALFEFDNLDLIMDDFSPQEIVNRITAYEAAKKTKPAEIEEGYRCRIYYTPLETDDFCMYGVTEEEAKQEVRRRIREYVAQKGRTASGEVMYVCRIKEEK